MSINKNEKRYWLHAITSLHVGAGRGLGYIDMPIAREKVTNWPYIPGSSLKGVIADKYNASDENRRNNDELKAAFGTSGSDNECAAGALVFTDANMFCLPVRSFYGTFAWITSPFCLRRLDITLSDSPADNEALISPKSALSKEEDGKFYLEDLDLNARKSEEAEKIARNAAGIIFADNKEWQKVFVERFAIVSDDIFTFLCEAGTEVSAHIKINDETGTAKDGALWYEEALPVESILTGKIWCDKVFVKHLKPEDLFARFCSGEINIQIGGKASTGKGQARCIFEEVQ